MQSSAEKFLSLKDVHLLAAAGSLHEESAGVCFLMAGMHLVIFINWKVLRLCWYNLVYPGITLYTLG